MTLHKIGSVFFQLAGTSLPSMCSSGPSAGTGETCDHDTEGHQSRLPGGLGCMDHLTESLVISRWSLLLRCA